MILILCATNRPQALTSKVVEFVENELKAMGERPMVFGMNELTNTFFQSELFGERTPEMEFQLTNTIYAAEKLVVVAPEYNGSFPGIFKVYLESLRWRALEGKKAALIGVATGRAGNQRGLDHLTGILHYMGVEVYSNKLPLSSIHKLMDEEGSIIDADTKKALRSQLEGFLKF